MTEFTWKTEENNSIERKQRYAWAALGWVTAWEHELQVGIFVYSVALERLAAEFSSPLSLQTQAKAPTHTPQA